MKCVVLCCLALVAAALPVAQAVRNNASLYHAVQSAAGEWSVVEGADPNAVAQAAFTKSWFQTGQNFLKVKTNGAFDSVTQAFAAGFIEGYVTADLIALWMGTDWVVASDVLAGEQAFVADNLAWMQDQIAQYNATDPWWFQAQLLLAQIQGLSAGYNATSPAKPFNFTMLLWNTLSAGDLDDLACIINPQSAWCHFVYEPEPVNPTAPPPSPRTRLRTARRRHKRLPPFSRCSGFVKLTDDRKDLFVAHGTWDDYNSMIRMVKYYDFAFTQTSDPTSGLIPATGHLFSSYPGVLISGDDFWVSSTGIVLISSEIGPVPQVDLYNDTLPQGTRWEFMRQIIASRLTDSAEDFADMFMVQNSGTFNNEWLVVDYNKFTPGEDLDDGAVWYIAQIPTLFMSYDITPLVNNQGFMGTFNIPFDAQIYDLSGWPAQWDKANATKYGRAFADLFTFNLNPRFRMATRDHSDIQTVEDMKTFIRYNQYQKDPLSQGPGTPAASPWHAISARADLVDPNGDYPSEITGDCFGGNDAKAVDSALVASMNMWHQVGPTHDDQPVFAFSKNPDLCNPTAYPHAGLPDVWDFDWQLTDWAI